MTLSPSAFCLSPLHLLCSYLSAFHFQLFNEFPFPPPLPHLQIPLTCRKDSHKANVMAGGTGWGCRGRNLAGLQVVKTKTSKGKRDGEIRPQTGKDQCWQWGNENILGCRRNTCIFGNCQQKRLHFHCKHFYSPVWNGRKTEHTAAFGVFFQRTEQHPSVKLPISKPFCMRHQPELSHILCANYSQLRCWTEPVGQALFQQLRSVTSTALPASKARFPKAQWCPLSQTLHT